MTESEAREMARDLVRGSIIDDAAAEAAYRQLEAEDAERDDTFAELQEMTAQPKETVDA